MFDLSALSDLDLIARTAMLEMDPQTVIVHCTICGAEIEILHAETRTAHRCEDCRDARLRNRARDSWVIGVTKGRLLLRPR
jgi:DNA-directed RNA polymerase subunit RPC12/RpoP